MPNELSAIGRSTSQTTKEVPTTEQNSGMSLSDFYKLLSAQLRYQDADNPMDTSEMMAQMVQTQMIGAITEMSSISSTTYAASMVGKEVSVAEIDEDGQYKGKTEGIVTGVVLGNNPVIYIGENPYLLSQIMVVGKEPPEKVTPPDDEKPDHPIVKPGGDDDTVDPPIA